MYRRIPSSFYLRKFRPAMLHPVRRSKWEQYLRYREASRSFRRYLQFRPSILSNPLQHLTMCFNRYETQPSPETYQALISFLFRKYRLHQIPPIVHHLEKHEKFELPEAMLVDMIKSYGNAHCIEGALHLFDRIPHLRCTRTVDSLDALLYALCKDREGRKRVPEILSKCATMNIRLAPSTFQLLITFLCKRGRIIHAMDILNCMVQNEFNPDEKTCSLLLSSLCENYKTNTSLDVTEVLFELRKTEFSPNLQDYRKILSFLDEKSEGLKALDVFNQMKLDGIKPDNECYTSVLSGVSNCEDYEKADKLFDEMLVYGLVPSLHTYNTYIKCLCKQNRVEEALQMMKAMEVLGCKCDSATYNTMLEWYCSNHQFAKAKELAEKMKTKGILRDMEFFRIFVSFLLKVGETKEGCVLLEEAMQSDLVMSGSSIEEIVCLLCEKNMVSTAVDLIRKFYIGNVGPSGKCWEALIYSSNLSPCSSFCK